MVHQREGLPLGFETRDDRARIHAKFDDLERHPTPDRFLLLGHPYDAAAAFADFLEQLVAANDHTGPFAAGPSWKWCGRRSGASGQKGFPVFKMRAQQCLNTSEKRRVAIAGCVHVTLPLVQRRELDRFLEYLLYA